MKNDPEQMVFPTQGLTVGMTLRDYFAAQALPAVTADLFQAVRNGDDIDDLNKVIAIDAYKLADAMLARRAEK